MNTEHRNLDQIQLTSRRAFLRRAGSTILGAATVPAILAACGASAAPASSSTGAGAAASASSSTGAAAAAPVASSAAGSASAVAGATGTLQVSNNDFLGESMDPIVGSGTFWNRAICDLLIDHDASGHYIGRVADSWDISPDGLTWTFHIHKGIKFHNGDPLTAQDVIFSMQHFGDKKSTNPWSPYVTAHATDISAPDDYTVVYKLQAPELSIREPLAQTIIMPKNYFAKVGEDGWQKAPIGSGPFKFVEHVPKTSLTLAANADYWGPDKPRWSKIVETLVPDEATRIAKLQRGEADIIPAVSADNQLSLKSKGFRLQQQGIDGFMSVSFSGTWLTKNPTSDIRVRQAMSYAINRQEIANTFYRGLAKPGGYWFWTTETWAHDYDPASWSAAKAPQLQYDLAKAKQLLQEAGFPDKFSQKTIPLYTPAGPSADLMQVLQGYWHNIGLAVDVKVVDTAVFYGLIFKRAKSATDQIVGAIWPWGPSGPATAFFNNVYHTANLFTSHGVLSTGNDPKADQLYQAAVHEPDESKAKKMWNDFMHYGYDVMWVNVPIVEAPSNLVVGPKVGSFGAYAKKLSLEEAYLGIQHAG